MKKARDIIPILETRGKYFCPAKWTELFLYLNHGTSNSCHHPIPHKIPLDGLKENPALLHNTPYKMDVRKQMLSGKKPTECHMCWHVEDLDSDVISDRIFKSRDYLDKVPSLDIDKNHVPDLIEIIFDNSCNLMCSYCDSGSSSQWSARIREKPIILKTEKRHLYAKQSIDSEFDNTPYYDAWMQWWPKIKDKVKLLKISGGEPLTSKKCINFLESINDPTSTNGSINSNFSVDEKYIARLINAAKNFQKFDVAVSLDAIGPMAEYARQNLRYQLLLDNIEYYLKNSSDNCFLHLQSTVSVFNIWGLCEKYDLMIDLRQRHGEKITPSYSTIVRFPQFQSISILPESIRTEMADKISNWLTEKKEYIFDRDIELIQKVIIYLRNEPTLFDEIPQQALKTDLIKFIKHYDETSKHKFVDVYPKEFINWLDL